MRTLQDILGDYEITDFLFRCRIDFKFFCERVLYDLFPKESGGLQDFHVEWFKLIQNNNRVAIKAPSGFGKTTILAVAYPIWLAFTYRNKQILIISKSLPQSTRILEIIKATIEDNELLLDLKPKNFTETWSKQTIKTTSGCRIFCRPYSINIKGERVDYILMDEAASYDRPDIYFDYIIPRLNPDGKICLISTPESTTDLLSQIEDRNLDYVIKTYPAIVNGKSIWEQRFSYEKLMQLKKEQGEQFFEKNFMCNPKAEPEGAIFSIANLMEGFDKDRDFSESYEGPTFIGCDFAISSGEKADYDAYVVIEKINNFFVIKKIETYKGLIAPAKIERICELNKIYKPISIVVDESNLGSTLIDELRAKALPVVAQSFQSKARKDLLMTLKNVIDSKKLIIPRSPNSETAIPVTNTLVEQLVGFKEEKSKLTQTKQIVSTASHDDIAMALAMAVKEAAEVKSASLIESW